MIYSKYINHVSKSAFCHCMCCYFFFQPKLADATWTAINATVAAARARSAQLTSRAATAARQVSMRIYILYLMLC